MSNNTSGREQKIIQYFYSAYLFLSFDKDVWTKLKIKSFKIHEIWYFSELLRKNNPEMLWMVPIRKI
jgi:hypothetical protein